MSTVFSSGSPISPENESQELSTLAAFIAHIERLQDQVRQKDAEIMELERVGAQLRQKHDQLEQEQKDMALQMDIQNDLLRRTRRTDAHIEQLRAAVIDREAIIGEKENSVRVVKRQLEHHKLLLQAQIRRHATMMQHATVDKDPLPDLSTLAARADIDKWIEKLQERLKKETSRIDEKEFRDPNDAQIANLRQEIDFYVREIIYYKLDIRGYKSDIKKLKKITAQLSSFGSRASDLESDTSSLRPATTPSRAPFTSTAPELGVSHVPSPMLTDPISDALLVSRPMTPPLSISAANPRTISRADGASTISKQVPPQLDLQLPMTPQTPSRNMGLRMANEAAHFDSEISPHSVVRSSPEQKKFTVCESVVSDTNPQSNVCLSRHHLIR
jgi:hypothetical protein